MPNSSIAGQISDLISNNTNDEQKGNLQKNWEYT